LVAKIRNKITEKIDTVLIGNKGLLKKNGIEVPEYKSVSKAQT